MSVLHIFMHALAMVGFVLSGISGDVDMLHSSFLVYIATRVTA